MVRRAVDFLGYEFRFVFFRYGVFECFIMSLFVVLA